MTEIRLAWSIAGRTDFAGTPIQHGRWVYADAQSRKDLGFSAEIGNQAFGAGTHWIEQREPQSFVATHGLRWLPPRRAATRVASRSAPWSPRRDR